MGLDLVELVMKLEMQFDLQIPDDVASGMQTIGDVTDWVSTQLFAEGRPQPRDAVLELVCAITCEQLGTTREQLAESTRFVEDLGAD